MNLYKFLLGYLIPYVSLTPYMNKGEDIIISLHEAVQFGS